MRLQSLPNKTPNAGRPQTPQTPPPPAPEPPPENHDSFQSFVFKHNIASAGLGAIPLYGAYKFAASAFTSGIMGSSKGVTPALLGAATNIGGSIALACGAYPAGLAGLAISAALGPAAKLSYL